MQDKETISYEKELYLELIKPVDSLWIKDIEPHINLQSEACRMYQQKTKEGRIAALDLYYHLIEEILGIILRYTRFILKRLSYPEKVNVIDLKQKSYWDLTVLIKNSIGFEGKDIILDKSNKIRKVRNTLMHDLVKRYHDIDVIQDTEGISKVYEELQETFLNKSLPSLSRTINELKNRKAIVQLMESSFPM